MTERGNKMEKVFTPTNMFSGDVETACARYGLGKASMRKVAEDANAVIRIGTRYLVNFGKVDMYMNSISE